MSAPIQRLRRIELEGLANLRNLGGYHTNDGAKTTKWGVVYRGDVPFRVSPDLAQQVLVDQLHIHHTYDLRGVTEATAKPYSFSGIHRTAVPVDMSDNNKYLKPGDDLKDPTAARRFMQEIYRDFVCSYARTVGAIIKGILASDASADNASLIHCTAGKDRTGWSCYVLLTLLDVTEEEKRADYTLTNSYCGIPADAWDYDGAEGMGEEAMAALWTVYQEYLDAALDEVEAMGGMHAYVKTHVGVTDEEIHKLRGMLLEDALVGKLSST